MPTLEVCPICADQTHTLRNRVLRPGQPPSACLWPGDNEPDSFHVGGFVDGVLVAIASVVPEPMPDVDPPAGGLPGSYRLRGMATDPDFRGQGVGSALLSYCIERAQTAGGRWLWCNARSSAVRFYQRAGFEVVGEEFDVPVIGPHVRMRLDLCRDVAAHAHT